MVIVVESREALMDARDAVRCGVFASRRSRLSRMKAFETALACHERSVVFDCCREMTELMSPVSEIFSRAGAFDDLMCSILAEVSPVESRQMLAVRAKSLRRDSLVRFESIVSAHEATVRTTCFRRFMREGVA